MKLTHIHVVIHLSSFTISHQSSLSPLCLPVRNISLRPNSATSSTIHIDARTSWMGLIATFFSPSIDQRHSICCMHNCLLTHAKALNQFRYFLTRFGQMKPRLHSVRWYCSCTLTSPFPFKASLWLCNLLRRLIAVGA